MSIQFFTKLAEIQKDGKIDIVKLAANVLSDQTTFAGQLCAQMGWAPNLGEYEVNLAEPSVIFNSVAEYAKGNPVSSDHFIAWLCEVHPHLIRFVLKVPDISPFSARMAEKVKITDKKQEKENTFLNRFTKNLSALAEAGALDPVIGREKEIDRAVQILCRRMKNNPVLVGSPGTGKSAIAEGIAQHLITTDNPQLQGRDILEVSMAGIVAGTKYRGEFEERIQRLIKEASEANVILFIDELHLVVGAGSASGSSMDAANILKPALARGELQIIGATTNEEYRKIIETDGALDRRFQRIQVDEPTADETLKILEGVVSNYASFHYVSYPPEVLKLAVDLAKEHVYDRFFPDKAIDLIDEAGARRSIASGNISPESQKRQSRIIELMTTLDTKVKEKDYTSIPELVQERDALFAVLKADMGESMFGPAPEVTEEDVRETLAVWKGVPVREIGRSAKEKIELIGTKLKSVLFGQDEAIDTLMSVVRSSLVGVKDPEKPAGVVLFVGPPGTGKTYSAKVLAECMFDSGDHFFRIDMSTMSEDHSVSRILGAPPGYVGHGDPSKLIEHFKKYPHSVLLIDEVDKAGDRVLDALLQLLDEGILTDSTGNKASFRNALVVMTTNCGSREVTEKTKNVGFLAQESSSSIAEKLTQSLKGKFKPELLSRIQKRVFFAPLSSDDLMKVCETEIRKISVSIDDKFGIMIGNIVIPTKVLDSKKDDILGARSVIGYIHTEIQDKLIELCLANEPGKYDFRVQDDGKCLLEKVEVDNVC